MGAKGWNDHRSAVAVISGIVDMLSAGREVNPAPDVCCVIRFEDVLSPVPQASITEQETFSAVGQIDLMVFLNSIGHERNPGAILLAVPKRAVGADPLIER